MPYNWKNWLPKLPPITWQQLDDMLRELKDNG